MNKWIVEELNILTGENKTREYDDYDEAIGDFKCAEQNENLSVSIRKKPGKLLLEG